MSHTDFVIVDDFMYVQHTDGMIRKYVLSGEPDENFTPIDVDATSADILDARCEAGIHIWDTKNGAPSCSWCGVTK